MKQQQVDPSVNQQLQHCPKAQMAVLQCNLQVTQSQDETVYESLGDLAASPLSRNTQLACLRLDRQVIKRCSKVAVTCSGCEICCSHVGCGLCCSLGLHGWVASLDMCGLCNLSFGSPSRALFVHAHDLGLSAFKHVYINEVEYSFVCGTPGHLCRAGLRRNSGLEVVGEERGQTTGSWLFYSCPLPMPVV
eukprot:973983-Pelagomonas_calceolata.AAC.1